jgi:hypothetical protein
MDALMRNLRAPASLLALTASYVARRPGAAFPAAQIAWRVGKQVRKAPILRPDRSVLATAAELVPVVSLISDTHVVAAGRTPCELEQEPEHALRQHSTTHRRRIRTQPAQHAEARR